MTERDSAAVPFIQRPILLVATGTAVGLVAIGLLGGTWGYFALRSGWHPIASTSLGCAIHKRFHSSTGAAVRADALHVAGECLRVSILGREEIVRDPKKIAAARVWFDSRSNLWSENFLDRPDESVPTMEIRSCASDGSSSDAHVYLSEDFIDLVPSKRFQRPICRGEWRQLAEILSPQNSAR